MLPSPSGELNIGNYREPGVRTPAGRIGPSLAWSLALHVAVIALVIVGLRSLAQAPPASEQVMSVDLVRLGDKTASPPVEEKAALPQEKEAGVAPPQPATPVPVAPLPPPMPQAKPVGSKEGVKPDPLAAVVPPPAPSAALDLATQLKSLATQQQQQAQTRPGRQRTDDAGSSNLTATSKTATPGRQAAYSVKDFIRAQIERHWYFDRAALGDGEIAIAIHMVLNRDGSVGSADIVEDPRYRASAAYRSLALSARNAVLMSSPLNLPQGRYDEVRDLTLTFDPKDVSR